MFGNLTPQLLCSLGGGHTYKPQDSITDPGYAVDLVGMETRGGEPKVPLTELQALCTAADARQSLERCLEVCTERFAQTQ